MVRKVLERVPYEVLQKDLEKYRQKAIELGATDAKVIPADMVIVDERVRAKCMVPICDSYGICGSCPPHAMDIDTTRKLVNSFQYAIFMKLEVPSEQVAGPEAETKKLTAPSRRKMNELVAKIEWEAFCDGYYLAVGFTVGACKNAYCPGIECSALVPGQGCRHPLKARSSMEAVGMDAFRMAAKVGWDVYPIGRSTSPSDVPIGLRLGLVLEVSVNNDN